MKAPQSTSRAHRLQQAAASEAAATRSGKPVPVEMKECDGIGTFLSQPYQQCSSSLQTIQCRCSLHMTVGTSIVGVRLPPLRSVDWRNFVLPFLQAAVGLASTSVGDNVICRLEGERVFVEATAVATGK